MKKLFVPFELAIQLKEKGFNEPCIQGVKDNEPLTGCGFGFTNQNNNQHDFVLPLHQQVVDWFREKHDIIINVAPTFAPKDKYITKYAFSITGANSRSSSGHDLYINVRPANHWFNVSSEHSKHIKLPVFMGSYYEALDKAIEEALKLIK